MKIHLINKTTKQEESVDIGFSNSVLFFAPIIALSKGLWGPAFISLFSIPLGNIYYSLKLNKIYARKLLSNGFEPATIEDKKNMENNGISKGKENSISLFQSSSGLKIDAPMGFSWSTLFYGPFEPLSRSHYLYFIIMTVAIPLTSAISIFVFPFIYNKIFIKSLLEKGYQPYEEPDFSKIESIDLQVIKKGSAA